MCCFLLRRRGQKVIIVAVLAIMAPIDLNKNKDTIVKAHKEVSDAKSETNWHVLCVLAPDTSRVSCLHFDFRIMAGPVYD